MKRRRLAREAEAQAANPEGSAGPAGSAFCHKLDICTDQASGMSQQQLSGFSDQAASGTQGLSQGKPLGPYGDAQPADLNASTGLNAPDTWQLTKDAQPGHAGMPELVNRDIALGAQHGGPDDQQKNMWWNAQNSDSVMTSQQASITDPHASSATISEQRPVCNADANLQQDNSLEQADGNPSVHVSASDASGHQAPSRPVSAATAQQQQKQQAPQTEVQGHPGEVSFDVRHMDLFQQQDTCDAFASFWRSTAGGQQDRLDAANGTRISAQGQAAGIALGGQAS